jgi:hypothetical protein
MMKRVIQHGQLAEQILLLDIREDQNSPTPLLAILRIGSTNAILTAPRRRHRLKKMRIRKRFQAVVILDDRQPQIPDVVAALHLPGRLARRIDRRQEQCHQRANDRDHHEQFHEGKARAALPLLVPVHFSISGA